MKSTLRVLLLARHAPSQMFAALVTMENNYSMELVYAMFKI
jgi:hypothetical protein